MEILTDQTIVTVGILGGILSSLPSQISTDPVVWNQWRSALGLPVAKLTISPPVDSVSTITWDATGLGAKFVRVTVNGQVFAEGGSTGSAQTGPWMNAGLVFALFDLTPNSPFGQKAIGVAQA